MNTAGRRKRSPEMSMDDFIIKELVDESKSYKIEAQNPWDKSMKMASYLTGKYVKSVPGFCTKNSLICSIFE